MFYSRPNIDPLGWDLQELPIENGSKNFDATTSDGRPVDFRFSGGWLSVKIGPIGAKRSDYNLLETVFLQPIAPFGTMDILPEQICDILGITVQGQKISVEYGKMGGRGFDWTGKTTTLIKTLYTTEAGILSLWAALEKNFPNILILESHLRHENKKWHRSRQHLPKNAITTGLHEPNVSKGYQICIDPVEGKNTQDLLVEVPMSDVSSADETREFFKFTFGLGIRRLGIAQPFKIKFPEIEFADIFTLGMGAEYDTNDEIATAYVAKLLSMLDHLYFSDVDIINLETKLPRPKLNQWEDYYFSNDLSDWCMGSDNRYLIGIVDSTGPAKGDWRHCAIRPSMSKTS